MPRSSNLRERILKIAGEQFLSQGFYKVSIDSLVAELRTSKSSIYKFFSSKESCARLLSRRPLDNFLFGNGVISTSLILISNLIY